MNRIRKQNATKTCRPAPIFCKPCCVVLPRFPARTEAFLSNLRGKHPLPLFPLVAPAPAKLCPLHTQLPRLIARSARGRSDRHRLPRLLRRRLEDAAWLSRARGRGFGGGRLFDVAPWLLLRDVLCAFPAAWGNRELGREILNGSRVETASRVFRARCEVPHGLWIEAASRV